MSLTDYQHTILNVLDLSGRYRRAKTDKDRARVWDTALRQLWATPQEFVDGIAAISQRTIALDLCAEEHTAKAPRWCGPGSNVGVADALTHLDCGARLDCHGSAWCNPDFLRKGAWARAVRGWKPTFLNVPPTTDQPWFGDLMEDPRAHLTTLDGRMRYLPPDGVESTSPNGGTVIWSINFDSPPLPPRLDWQEVCEIGKAVRL